MKKESMRKYSLLGLVLIGASAVTAAVLPKDNDKKQSIGRLVATAVGDGQLTCVQGSGLACTLTAAAGTRTTAVKPGTSLITLNPNEKVKSITQQLQSGNEVIVNNIHTSQD